MGEAGSIEQALALAVSALTQAQRKFAVVGGLAVSLRAEIRFTRDVDLAVQVSDDRDAEQLIFSLQARGFRPVATVEHDVQKRLSTIRMLAPNDVKVDLLFASSGIESEVVSRATPMTLPNVGEVLVASAEELLSMKVLSMTERRLQDKLDAINLLAFNVIDLERVRSNLALIRARGFGRDEDLDEKLSSVLNAPK